MGIYEKITKKQSAGTVIRYRDLCFHSSHSTPFFFPFWHDGFIFEDFILEIPPLFLWHRYQYRISFYDSPFPEQNESFWNRYQLFPNVLLIDFVIFWMFFILCTMNTISFWLNCQHIFSFFLFYPSLFSPIWYRYHISNSSLTFVFPHDTIK